MSTSSMCPSNRCGKHLSVTVQLPFCRNPINLSSSQQMTLSFIFPPLECYLFVRFGSKPPQPHRLSSRYTYNNFPVAPADIQPTELFPPAAAVPPSWKSACSLQHGVACARLHEFASLGMMLQIIILK